MTEYKAREYEMIEAIPYESDAYYLCNGETMEAEEVLKRLREHEAAREALLQINDCTDAEGNLNINDLNWILNLVDTARQALGGGEG